MNKRIISVIIPVYNVFAYLPECMESVLSQDYTNLEIILIDDGSKDDSGKICDQYAQKDSRIRVIHQPNSGAGAAKNAGLRAATGEYLAFVDSDDCLEPGAFTHMLMLLDEHDADVAQCAFHYWRPSGVMPLVSGNNCLVEDGITFLARFTHDWTVSLLWNKLYKRKLFEGVFFEEGHAIDDEFFTYQGIMRAKKAVYDDHFVYKYRMRRSSVMHSAQLGRQRLMDKLDYLGERRKKIITNYPQLRRLFNCDYLDRLLALSRDPYSTNQTIADIKRLQKEYFMNEDWTMPGISSWPAHLFLAFATPETLLKKCRPVTIHKDEEDLFA